MIRLRTAPALRGNQRLSNTLATALKGSDAIATYGILELLRAEAIPPETDLRIAAKLAGL